MEASLIIEHRGAQDRLQTGQPIPFDNAAARSAAGHDNDALFPGFADFILVRQHLVLRFQRSHGDIDLSVLDLLKTCQAARDIHRHVAAANDHGLVRHLEPLAVADVPEQFDG